jgi:DNA-binding protein YbaB
VSDTPMTDAAALDEALEAIQAMRARASDAAAGLAAAQQTAREVQSADGLVTVTAAGGRLGRVDIDPRAFDRTDHAALTATLLATARAALAPADAS